MHKIIGSFALNDESPITESINNYDSQTQELWGSTSAEYDDNIIYDDTISNPPSTSSPVPQSSSSRRAAKRKLSVVQEDLLGELKRANERSEAQMDTANTIAANANKIMGKILEFMKSDGK